MSNRSTQVRVRADMMWRLYESGQSMTAVGKIFNCSRQRIHEIFVREGFQSRIQTPTPRKLTSRQVIEIRYSSDMAKDMATRFEVSVKTIYNIRNNRTWKHISA